MIKIKRIAEKNYEHNRISQKMNYKKYRYLDPTWKIVRAALLYASYNYIDVADVIRDVDSQILFLKPLPFSKLKKLLEVYGVSCQENRDLDILQIKDRDCAFILRYWGAWGPEYCFGNKTAGSSTIHFVFTNWQDKTNMTFRDFWKRFVRGKQVKMLILSPKTTN